MLMVDTNINLKDGKKVILYFVVEETASLLSLHKDMALSRLTSLQMRIHSINLLPKIFKEAMKTTKTSLSKL